MPKIVCPVCCSANASIGVREFSTNAAIVCNSCNFADIVFYGESYREAIDYCEAIFARRRRHSCVRFKSRRKVPQLRFFQHRQGVSAVRKLLVFLPFLWSRMVDRKDVRSDRFLSQVYNPRLVLR